MFVSMINNLNRELNTNNKNNFETHHAAIHKKTDAKCGVMFCFCWMGFDVLFEFRFASLLINTVYIAEYKTKQNKTS